MEDNGLKNDRLLLEPEEDSCFDLTDSPYPVIALRGLVLFPHETLRFDVARKQSLAAVKAALDSGRSAFFTSQKDVSVDNPTLPDLNRIGTVGHILKVIRSPETDALQVIVRGFCRAEIDESRDTAGCLTVTVKYLEDILPDSRQADVEEAAVRKARSLFYRYAELTDCITPDLVYAAEQASAPELSLLIVGSVYLDCSLKQSILEESDVMERLESVIVALMNEIHLLEIEDDIEKKLQERLDRGQREFYLHEQMHLIAEELGETDSMPSDDTKKYKEKIAASNMPEDCKKILREELERLNMMPVSSPDANVVRTYLDRCLELPWGVYTKDRLNLTHAQKVLDADHYGLKDVKERIIELIAARAVSPDIKGQILCFAGPPGVGKTSIVRSIAVALGRKYRRIALGGVHDEAEIRGHRRTYIGAIPGRIMNAIAEAGSSNPVILLDEIDKLAGDFRGDPASALLEVLDGEQNNSFRDHYIDMPFDLSRVLFITTANDPYAIPDALRDRMEVIELYSYTAEEKFQIARRHLVKKQMKEHNLTAKQLRISDRALRLMIEGYTREAGVRQLERLIAKVCRKTTVSVLQSPDQKVTVDDKNLESFLGVRKYRAPEDARDNTVGLVNGLAWTSVGGELLQVETAILDGSGKIELTGSLGDVMKESARAAVSFVRSRAELYGIDREFYKNRDIHIHVPEGAVPKDGPSAGVTIVTCLVSALTGIPVLGTVAMTGEITLRGRVLPIGGLKEKSMAAYKANMKTVLIPQDNLPDLETIDETVREKLTFVPVATVDEVLERALETRVGKPQPVREKGKRKDFMTTEKKTGRREWAN